MKLKFEFRFMKAILFSIMVLLIGCNDSTRNLKNKLPNNLTKIDSLKNKLMGRWGGLDEASPVFEIRKDSVYYFQRSAAYSYKILNNNLIINLPESPATLINITVIKDTLFFSDDQGHSITGYRFKNKKK